MGKKHCLNFFLLLLVSNLFAYYHQSWSYEYDSRLKNVQVSNGKLFAFTEDEGLILHNFSENEISEPIYTNDSINHVVIDGEDIYSRNDRVITKYEISGDSLISVNEFEIPQEIVVDDPSQFYIGNGKLAVVTSIVGEGFNRVSSIYIFNITDFNNISFEFSREEIGGYDWIGKVYLLEDELMYSYDGSIICCNYQNIDNYEFNNSPLNYHIFFISEEYYYAEPNKLFKRVENSIELIEEFDFGTYYFSKYNESLIIKTSEYKYQKYDLETNELNPNYYSYSSTGFVLAYDDLFFLYNRYGDDSVRCIKMDESNHNHVTSLDIFSSETTMKDGLLFCNVGDALHIYNANYFDDYCIIDLMGFNDVVVGNGKVYSYDVQDGIGEMRVLDITNLGSPVLDFTIDIVNLGIPIYASNGYVYFVKNNIVSVVQFGDNNTYEIISNVQGEFISSSSDIVNNEEYLFLFQYGFYAAINLNNDNHFYGEYDSQLSSHQIKTVKAYNNHIYKSDSDGNLEIVDFTNIYEPTVICVLDDYDYKYFTVQDNQLIVTDYTSNNLTFFDLETIVPAFIKNFAFNSYIMDVFRSEDYYIFDCFIYGIHVYNSDVTPTEHNDDLVLNSELSWYPNPVLLSSSERTAQSRIEFTLKNTVKTNIAVYNIKGQKIKTLIDRRLSEGKHIVSWDGKNRDNVKVASGIYLAVLKENNKVTGIRKCILVK
jgi:hypothetical protein